MTNEFAKPFSFLLPRADKRRLAEREMLMTKGEKSAQAGLNAFHRFGVNVQQMDHTRRKRIADMDGNYR